MESADKDIQSQEGESSPLTEDEKKYMRIALQHGLCVTLSAYLLDRLLMALAMQIVNKNTNCDGTLEYDDLTTALGKVKEKFKMHSSRPKKDICMKLCIAAAELRSKTDQATFKSLQGMVRELSAIFTSEETQNKDCHMNFLKNTKSLSEITWNDCPASFQSEEQLNEASQKEDSKPSLFNRTLQGLEKKNLSTDCVKKLRVAAVYTEFISLRVPWYVFELKLVVDILFPGKGIVKKDGKFILTKEHRPEVMTPGHMINKIFEWRNESAHPDFDTKTNIEEFMQHVDGVDRLLNPYFPDSTAEVSGEGEKRNLKLLFGVDIISKDKYYTDMKAALPNFEEKVMKKVEDLVGDKNNVKDDVTWDLIKECSSIHPAVSNLANPYYKQLLVKINDPDRIIRLHPQDGQRLKHLAEVHKKEDSVTHITTSRPEGDEEGETDKVVTETAEILKIQLQYTRTSGMQQVLTPEMEFKNMLLHIQIPLIRHTLSGTPANVKTMIRLLPNTDTTQLDEGSGIRFR